MAKSCIVGPLAQSLNQSTTATATATATATTTTRTDFLSASPTTLHEEIRTRINLVKKLINTTNNNPNLINFTTTNNFDNNYSHLTTTKGAKTAENQPPNKMGTLTKNNIDNSFQNNIDKDNQQQQASIKNVLTSGPKDLNAGLVEEEESCNEPLIKHTSAWTTPQNLATWIDNEVNSFLSLLEAQRQLLVKEKQLKHSTKRKWLSSGINTKFRSSATATTAAGSRSN